MNIRQAYSGVMLQKHFVNEVRLGVLVHCDYFREILLPGEPEFDVLLYSANRLPSALSCDLLEIHSMPLRRKTDESVDGLTYIVDKEKGFNFYIDGERIRVIDSVDWYNRFAPLLNHHIALRPRLRDS
jgi:hypothetical protein